ncbi:hypothetical protein BDK51DRAFT_40186 [Blyttiomyces helicus]|uniref:Uncharacterized protein n=1 Tax=Blyttiomyces helicus TaxID=388810 RepID=A0A4V1IR78_9FUNG|nr:hypothetical protein BDK51DRAFT_40186 [Blyttiomyces helicus]|eukprot:RKO89107.1 hypothetical protein BDK51DRAFT_40186 [Blyttiomyces helicus]
MSLVRVATVFERDVGTPAHHSAEDGADTSTAESRTGSVPDVNRLVLVVAGVVVQLQSFTNLADIASKRYADRLSVPISPVVHPEEMVLLFVFRSDDASRSDRSLTGASIVPLAAVPPAVVTLQILIRIGANPPLPRPAAGALCSRRAKGVALEVRGNQEGWRPSDTSRAPPFASGQAVERSDPIRSDPTQLHRQSAGPSPIAELEFIAQPTPAHSL